VNGLKEEENKLNNFKLKNDLLTELEQESFKKQLYRFRDLIRNKELSEAKEAQEKIEQIINAEAVDFELVTLYRLFEVLFLLHNEGVETANKKIQEFEDILDKMNDEHLYHYNYYRALILHTDEKYEDAITFYNRALEILESISGICSLLDDEEIVCYNLALCYTELERPSRAIVALNGMSKFDLSGKLNTHSMGFDMLRAINYYKIGLFKESEEILNDCNSRASDMNSKLYIGLSLQNLGILNTYLKEWEKAEEYFSKAIDYFEEDTWYHVWALYLRFYCKTELGDLKQLEREIMKTETEFAKYEKYHVFLKTMKHILRIKKAFGTYNIEVVEYIEEVSIPYFIDNYHRLEALECCKLLVQHFERTNKQKKIPEIHRIMVEIYERMTNV